MDRSCDECIHWYEEPKCSLELDANSCLSFEEASFKLTESGEAEAVKLIGGQDIANVASGLLKILVESGDLIGSQVEDNPHTWATMVQIAKLWRHYNCLDWRTLVKKFEDEVLEPTGYFNTMPYAFDEEIK